MPRTAAVLSLVWLAAGCGGQADSLYAERARALPPPPGELNAGAVAFRQHCAECHGPLADGTETGPPLLHLYYVPSHHGDEAFALAVRTGVRAHHWRFGDMPPQPQVGGAEIAAIVEYVRWLQREVGLY